MRPERWFQGNVDDEFARMGTSSIDGKETEGALSILHVDSFPEEARLELGPLQPTQVNRRPGSVRLRLCGGPLFRAL